MSGLVLKAVLDLKLILHRRESPEVSQFSSTQIYLAFYLCHGHVGTRGGKWSIALSLEVVQTLKDKKLSNILW